MKKIIMLSAILFALPSYATCPIESGETVCSLPGFREQISPTYQPIPLMGDETSQPNVELIPQQRNEIENQFREFAPSGSDLNYNSSCQFGVCLQNRSTPLFKQPIQ